MHPGRRPEIKPYDMPKTRRSPRRSPRRTVPGRATLPTCLTALLLALAFGGGTACESGYEARFAEARRALAEDRQDDAARIYRDIALSDPSAPEAAQAELELARIQYLRLRDVRSAHDRLVRLLDEHPESPFARPARNLLARIYARELDEPARALEHYRLLAEGETDSDRRRDLLLAMAECHYRLDQLPEARIAYRAAIALPYAADTDAAYLRLARLEYSLGDPETALSLLSALEARTASEEHRREAALTATEVLIESKRYDEAAARLDTLQRAYPESDEVLALQVRLLEAQETSQPLEPGANALASLQERIHWGAGRRARARRDQP